MSLFSSIRRRYRRWRATRRPPAAGDGGPPMSKEADRDWEPHVVRRWDGAETHRLNRAHWSRAYGQSINLDLLDQLDTLRARCAYEMQNDPILEGIVSTYAGDVVGPAGPKLQVRSDNDAYNDVVEEAFAEYAEQPDPTREMSLADVLRVDVRMLFPAGEFLHQFTNTRRDGPFEFAILSPHPRRLETPAGRAGDAAMFMGLELARTGAVRRYHFRDEPPGQRAWSTAHWSPVEAQNVQHRFLVHEPDQLRGFPWLSVSLDDIADLRDLDKHVMEAAKNAAATGVVWAAMHPEALLEFQTVNGVWELQPGMQQAGPPGWQPTMVQPTQPSAQYKEYRHERLRSYGRMIGMPLMMILLSSEGNSFSGANHDGQIYIRSVQGMQHWLAAGTLTPQARQIAAEVAIAKRIVRPRKVEFEFGWVKPPHPDPRKNYEAIRMQLEDGTMSLKEACAALDRDFDSVCAARAYVQTKLTDLGLPLPPVNLGSASGRRANVLRETADQLDQQDDEAQATNDRQTAAAAQ